MFKVLGNFDRDKTPFIHTLVTQFYVLENVPCAQGPFTTGGGGGGGGKLKLQNHH